MYDLLVEDRYLTTDDSLLNLNPSCRHAWEILSILCSFAPSFAPSLPVRLFLIESADSINHNKHFGL